MKEILLVLLGIGIWQLVIFITILVTDEDEHKVYGLGMGIIGWLLYGIAILIATITGSYTIEGQTKRIVKSAKKRLKKSKKNWLKWYKKYGKYSSCAWNNAFENNRELFRQMKATGFDYGDSTND